MNENYSQRNLIEKRDWDCLLVLDACRYDYFEKVHGDYLNGNLKKAVSEGSSTTEWLKKTFNGKKYEDVTYISANPFINSKTTIGPIKPRKNFRKILDVWDWGWDKSLNTVPPKPVIENGGEVNGRKIIHFLQPHAPYIGNGRSDGGGISLSSVFPLKSYPPLVFILSTIGKYLSGSFWSAILKLGAEYSISKHGIDSVLKGYEDNLRLVLEKISNHIEKFDGRVVLTSDHGEAFGEGGIYEHPPNQSCPALNEVPWLEIEN